jgi:hypothetical protein
MVNFEKKHRPQQITAPVVSLQNDSMGMVSLGTFSLGIFWRNA